MDWFKMHHEARNDRKLATLSAEQFRVWFNLLCMAAESKERGTVKFDDIELLALEVAGGDAELTEQSISRLVKLRIISNENGEIHFLSWLKRQHDKPSDMPAAVKERVARFRAKKSGVTDEDETPDESQVTPCNAQKRDVTPQIRIDKIRTDTEKNNNNGNGGNDFPLLKATTCSQKETIEKMRSSLGLPVGDIPKTSAEATAVITQLTEVQKHRHDAPAKFVHTPSPYPKVVVPPERRAELEMIARGEPLPASPGLMKFLEGKN
jgi:hypothetical protein